MSSEKTLKQRLIDAGYPEKEMDHHGSDLYVYVTPLTTGIIKAFYEEHNWILEHNVEKFIDIITKRPMYDCAFQWYE